MSSRLTAFLTCLACGMPLLGGCDSLKPQSGKPAGSQAADSSSASTAQTNPQQLSSPAAPGAGDEAAGDEAAGEAATGEDAAMHPIFQSQGPSGSPQAPASSPAPKLVDQNEFQKRLFGDLQLPDTQDPEQLIKYTQKVDAAIQDLMVASANNIIDEGTFKNSGLRLGKLKLASAQRLAELPEASVEQRKAGQLAQLVALSHLSGFRDVEAAQQLEKYAAQLSQSPDLDLAHQSRVVGMGFQLQALQNGLVSEPGELLEQAKGLFTRPEDRNFPELMMLLQSSQVLTQMGFEDAAKQIDAILIAEYRNSPDLRLRTESWNVETRGSQALENYLIAFRSLGSDTFDAPAALAAARGLFEAFPNVQTLEQLAGTITNIEYGGNIEVSRQLADLIEQKMPQLPADAPRDDIQAILSGHHARMALVGQPLPLQGIVGFDGRPFNWSDYEGKVVLVDFWATWCVPCLKEIPEIRKAYENLHEQGFEVVSVNMDENLADAADFLSKRNYPWRSFRATDSNQLGFKSSFAKELGIGAIPFMVLVDRSGKVAAIHVRGDKLTPSVRGLLGLATSLIPEE